MSKPESAFRIQVEYYAARGAAFLFRLLPLPLAVCCGRALAYCLYLIDGRHRRRAAEHLGVAFGGRFSPTEIRRLARSMYLHFGTMLAECARIPSLRPEQALASVDWNGGDQVLSELAREGRGLVLAGGHLGNWEMCGLCLNRLGVMGGAIARPLDNPRLEEFVKEMRRRWGQKIWDKRGALRGVLRELRDCGGCGMLVDQDAGKEGIFLPLFGVACSTLPTPAELALRTGAPIIACALHRAGGPMRFRFTYRGPFRADPAAEPEAEIRRLLLLINGAFESIIAEAPEQWIWLHKRWKTLPPGAETGPHGT